MIARKRWLRDDAFAGRRVLITGGASGMGAALARIVFDHGGQAAILDRNASLQPIADAPDGSAKEFRVDLRDKDAIIQAVADAARWMDGIDLVANVAGAFANGTLADTDIDAMYDPFFVNMFAPLHVCREAFPWLRKATDPAVVNVASMAGSFAYPGGGLYSAGKAALVMTSRQLALEWARYGIRVNVMSPGMYDTPMGNRPISATNRQDRDKKIPMKRRGDPEEAANVIAFLLSPGASYLNAQEITVNGGLDQTVFTDSGWWVKHENELDSQPDEGR